MSKTMVGRFHVGTGSVVSSHWVPEGCGVYDVTAKHFIPRGGKLGVGHRHALVQGTQFSSLSAAANAMLELTGAERQAKHDAAVHAAAARKKSAAVKRKSSKAKKAKPAKPAVPKPAAVPKSAAVPKPAVAAKPAGVKKQRKTKTAAPPKTAAAAAQAAPASPAPRGPARPDVLSLEELSSDGDLD
eukprot:Hpha_TRINITY_DN19193_c0_g1::TRINITY_DN19193_c0_g1_i1::g.94699::m.94699